MTTVHYHPRDIYINNPNNHSFYILLIDARKYKIIYGSKPFWNSLSPLCEYKTVLYSDYSDIVNCHLFTVARNITLSDKREIFIIKYKRITLESYFHIKVSTNF